MKCESAGQFLGMAEPDLYLLEASQPFALNFVKGMVGRVVPAVHRDRAGGRVQHLPQRRAQPVAHRGDLHARLTSPTHLNDLATNRNVGGGPFESMSQLMQGRAADDAVGDTSGAKACSWPTGLGLGVPPHPERDPGRRIVHLDALRLRRVQHQHANTWCERLDVVRLFVPVGDAGVLSDEVARSGRASRVANPMRFANCLPSRPRDDDYEPASEGRGPPQGVVLRGDPGSVHGQHVLPRARSPRRPDGEPTCGFRSGGTTVPRHPRTQSAAATALAAQEHHEPVARGSNSANSTKAIPKSRAKRFDSA